MYEGRLLFATLLRWCEETLETQKWACLRLRHAGAAFYLLTNDVYLPHLPTRFIPFNTVSSRTACSPLILFVIRAYQIDLCNARA